MASTRLSICADQVRRQDRDRYLTALFAPAERREDLFALYAFNLEVAKTAEVVSEAIMRAGRAPMRSSRPWPKRWSATACPGRRSTG
jgi:phytoene/squalene synthetase